MNHVLIIEDEPLLALLIQSVLEEEGVASFDIAASESDAVRFALAHHPKLITSDVCLLEGTGPAAVTHILRELGEIPVIFISGTPEKCHPCEQPSILLSKPFDNANLRKAFRELLKAA